MCDRDHPCVPYFEVESMRVHYGKCNKRMLIALITVCLTFLLLTCIFVKGYTDREKIVIETILQTTRTEGENAAGAQGVHQ